LHFFSFFFLFLNFHPLILCPVRAFPSKKYIKKKSWFILLLPASLFLVNDRIWKRIGINYLISLSLSPSSIYSDASIARNF
jgi:hypothetical protein